MGTGWVVFGISIFAISLIYSLYFLKNVTYIKKYLLILSVFSTIVFYVYGFIYFDNEVRKHCYHGNCKHGWNSQHTVKYQWHCILYVIIGGFGIGYLYVKINNQIERQEKINAQLDKYIIKYKKPI